MQNSEPKKIRLHWQKLIPAKELEAGMHFEFMKKNGGIYLWIFDGTPNRVCYIGEAGVFQDRLGGDHLNYFKIAGYTLYNLERSQDWLGFIAEHLNGKTIAEVNSIGKIRIPTAPHPTADDSTDEDKANSVSFFSKLKFALATVDPESENTKEGRRQIEAALIYRMRDFYKSESKCDLRTRGDREKLLGNISKAPSTSYSFEHAGEAAKHLPPEFLRVVRF